eukprot:4756609-Pleurochrysis_carterae.AAC.1
MDVDRKMMHIQSFRIASASHCERISFVSYFTRSSGCASWGPGIRRRSLATVSLATVSLATVSLAT